jgi:hypothetical protein
MINPNQGQLQTCRAPVRGVTGWGGFMRKESRGMHDAVINLRDHVWGREGSAWIENKNDFTDTKDHVSANEEEDSEEAVITQHGFNGYEGLSA